MHDRHVLIVSIDEYGLSLLFQEGATIRCMVGVPPDALLLGVHTDWARRTFCAMFEHPSFPLCRIGEEARSRNVAFEIIEHPQADLIDVYPRYIGTERNEAVITARGRRFDPVKD